MTINVWQIIPQVPWNQSEQWTTWASQEAGRHNATWWPERNSLQQVPSHCQVRNTSPACSQSEFGVDGLRADGPHKEKGDDALYSLCNEFHLPKSVAVKLLQFILRMFSERCWLISSSITITPTNAELFRLTPFNGPQHCSGELYNGMFPEWSRLRSPMYCQV